MEVKYLVLGVGSLTLNRFMEIRRLTDTQILLEARKFIDIIL